jgi:hypothetical protein
MFGEEHSTIFTGFKMSKGKKFDQNKTRWDLLPFKAMEEINQVLMFGALKYGDDNWKKVENYKIRYFNACCRHLFAWFRGEKIDQESGFNHLAHAACCILFLLEKDCE